VVGVVEASDPKLCACLTPCALFPAFAPATGAMAVDWIDWRAWGVIVARLSRGEGDASRGPVRATRRSLMQLR
jgi:hypothetical protein